MRRRSLLASALAVVLVPFAAACGGPTAQQTTTGGGSGGPTGGSGGSATGGQSTVGSGGSSTGGASIDGAPACGPGAARIDVALDGKDVTAGVVLGGVSTMSDGVHVEIGNYGELYLRSTDGDALGVPHPVSALLRMPEDSQEPGAWYCGGDGSEMLLGADLSVCQVVLRSVSALGKCPGKPVDGTMEVCFPGQPCPPAIKSTVPGATFDVLLKGFDGVSGPLGGTEAKVLATINGAGGFVMLQATSIDPASSDVQTSTLGIGTVTVPEGLPDAGAVYCIGDGSTLEYKMSSGLPAPLHATLKGLSRLGVCPAAPAAGQIGLCMNMNE